MKRLTTAFAFLSILTFGQAQIDKLKERLNLTPEQTEQIRPIIEEEAGKIKEIRAKHENESSRRGKLNMLRELQKVQEDAQKRIEPILTAEQRREWKEIREERREELKEQVRERRR